MLFRTTILTAAILPLGSVAALAQAPAADQMRMLHLAVANQLGIVEFCQSHGWADDAAIDAQKKIAATLPPSSDSSGLGDAENDGKQGMISANGNKVSLADAASKKGTTVQAICTQLSGTVKTAWNNLQNAPKAPGVPKAQ
jgi:hypothetical protein